VIYHTAFGASREPAEAGTAGKQAEEEMTVLLQGPPVDFSDLICPLAGIFAIIILGAGLIRFFRFRELIKPKPRGFEVILPDDDRSPDDSMPQDQ